METAGAVLVTHTEITAWLSDSGWMFKDCHPALMVYGATCDVSCASEMLTALLVVLLSCPFWANSQTGEAKTPGWDAELHE